MEIIEIESKKYFSITKERNQLSLTTDWWAYDRIGFLCYLFFSVIAGIWLLSLIFSALGFGMFTDVGGLIMFSLIFPIFILAPICGLIIDIKRKTEIIADKSSQKLLYRKISPNFRILQTLEFDEINYIFYEAGFTEFGLSLNSHLKEKCFFIGNKKDCENIGLIFAGFLEKPLYFKSSGILHEISQDR